MSEGNTINPEQAPGSWNEEEGTEVAGGNHIVPKGVAVEELDGGKQKLLDECPASVRTLLEEKGGEAAMLVYNRMIEGIVNESKTRTTILGKWNDKEIVSVMDLFRDDFAEYGMKLALCKRKSLKGTFRWIEFIDTDSAPSYVPSFDVANRSGQTITTIYTTLKFPKGVAVEELKEWRSRNRLRDTIPVYVEVLIREKDLMVEYEQLVEACITHGVGARFKNWNTKKLKEVISDFRPRFEAKGIALFVSQKDEWVQHGNTGHTENFRWIEFVDRSIQPNYFPQRDADNKKKECIIS